MMFCQCDRDVNAMSSRPVESNIEEQVVTTPEDLAECCRHIADVPAFGLDTEFVGEDTYHPHLCLVQVATPERLILIDPLTTGPLDEFWALATDSSHEVIVHAGREEVRLCRLWAGKPPGKLRDLQIAAGLVGFSYPMSHASLVSQVLKIQMAKGETLTEWRDRPLTSAQVRYAFDDVRHLLALWAHLRTLLDTLGRFAWAEEEFERLAIATGGDEIAVERWRKLRGLGALDRRRLAMVRELYVWREETAAKTNRPARVICRDDLLVEIAKRNPTHERDLAVVRGLSRRHLAAILHVLDKARRLPMEACPPPAGREQDSPQTLMVAGVLNAVLADLCARQRLAANLVASGADVRTLIRSHPNVMPLESLLGQGWRHKHILPELRAVLAGEVQIRVRDARSETPFGYERVKMPTD
jgi:ribonuclease D